jgi:hypothetical protein
MKDTCVAVLAYNRPEFLYVTLDSIFRNKCIEEVDVNVYIDGGSDKLPEMQEVISNFHVNQTVIDDVNRKVLWAHVTGLEHVFNSGYNRCIYIEDDHILRSDTIEYCLNYNPKQFILSLSGKGGTGSHYRPMGNMITKDNFYELDAWVRDFKFVGMIRPGHLQQIMHPCWNGHDSVFYAFLLANNKLSEFANNYYVAHFGIKGIHFVNQTPESLDMYNKMFAGDRSLWLDRIVKIIKEGNYDNKLDSALWLKGVFDYK